jgi:hypothetical protein
LKQCPDPTFNLPAAILNPPSPTPTVIEYEELKDPLLISERLMEEKIKIRDYGYKPVKTDGPGGVA